jgi:hypothetical protein
MTSIFPDYSYDIFISYRQKDNKHDGWVTEFVRNLKGELESAFKEEISVYFDENPHDGLLETHDVDASLKDKLKCLIFIPIISRTYCDPKSFAWEHEFKAFVEMASKDQFGLKVKLSNGNVASRVLPVRIYDLKKEDIVLCEQVLGSVLRGVELIYKSAGVNRPLRENEENATENLGKIYYRDQINKLGQSIQDIIDSMTAGTEERLRTNNTEPKKQEQQVKRNIKHLPLNKFIKICISIFLISGFLLVAYALIFRIPLFKNNSSEEILNKAIMAVDPYDNWQDYHGKIRLRNVRIDAEDEYNEIIEIWTKNDDYKRIWISDTQKIVTGFNNSKFFGYEIKNNNDTINRISISDSNTYYGTRYFRRHHFCQFGLLMELKKSGMTLDRKVTKEDFQGKKCLKLLFTSQGEEVKEDYFKGSVWTIFIDPLNYSLKGYKIKSSNKEYVVVLNGNIRVSGLNIPLCKIWYISPDNFLMMDIITPEK